MRFARIVLPRIEELPSRMRPTGDFENPAVDNSLCNPSICYRCGSSCSLQLMNMIHAESQQPQCTSLDRRPA